MSIVIYNATVMRVSPHQDKNRETGEISNIHKVDLVHTSSEAANADMDVITIKLKEQVQADAFQKAVNQQVNVPVRVWSVGGQYGFWLEKGVLPTVAQRKAA